MAYFQQPITLFDAIVLGVFILTLVFLYRTIVHIKTHDNAIYKIPSVIVLGPETHAKKQIVTELAKNEIKKPRIDETAHVCYIEDEKKKIQMVMPFGTYSDEEKTRQFKKFNYQSIIYVFDPFMPLDGQISQLENASQIFSISPIAVVYDNTTKKQIRRIQDKFTNIKKLSFEKQKGFDELRKLLIKT